MLFQVLDELSTNYFKQMQKTSIRDKISLFLSSVSWLIKISYIMLTVTVLAKIKGRNPLPSVIKKCF